MSFLPRPGWLLGRTLGLVGRVALKVGVTRRMLLTVVGDGDLGLDLGLFCVGGRAVWKVGLGSTWGCRAEALEVDLAATVHRGLSSGSSHLTALANHMPVMCWIRRAVVRGAGRFYLGFEHQTLHSYEMVALLDPESVTREGRRVSNINSD